MIAKLKRRWFRFSLRMLFIAILIVSLPLGWCAWTLHEVRERARILRLADNISDSGGPFNSELPWRLKIFGAKPVGKIFVDEKAPEDIYLQIVAAYPEAVVRRSDIAKDFPDPMPFKLLKALRHLF